MENEFFFKPKNISNKIQKLNEENKRSDELVKFIVVWIESSRLQRQKILDLFIKSEKILEHERKFILDMLSFLNEIENHFNVAINMISKNSKRKTNASVIRKFLKKK